MHKSKELHLPLAFNIVTASSSPLRSKVALFIVSAMDLYMVSTMSRRPSTSQATNPGTLESFVKKGGFWGDVLGGLQGVAGVLAVPPSWIAPEYEKEFLEPLSCLRVLGMARVLLQGCLSLVIARTGTSIEAVLF